MDLFTSVASFPPEGVIDDDDGDDADEYDVPDDVLPVDSADEEVPLASSSKCL